MMSQTTIAVTTWSRYQERFTYLQQAINALSLLKNYKQARLLVSAETENALCRDQLCEFCNKVGADLIWQPGQADVSTNINYLMDHVDTKFFLYVQDDFVLNHSLDLTYDFEIINHNYVDMVNYAWWTTPERVRELKVIMLNDIKYYLLDPTHLPAYPGYYNHGPHLARLSTVRSVGEQVFNGRSLGYAYSEMEYDMRMRDAGVRIAGRGPGWNNTSWLQHFSSVGVKSSMSEKWLLAKVDQECP